MSRLFAFMTNDPGRVRCALHRASNLLVTKPDPAQAALDGWGIGFYQDEVLLQRRPKVPAAPIDFYALARDLRTDVIIGHVRAGTVGSAKIENTHPFRFRVWLFAHHGTIPAFETHRDALLLRVPDFLARNIRGETDSELLFHLYLAFLHEAGKLDDQTVSTRVAAEALKETLAFVDGVVGAGNRGADCALAITNGRILLATRRGAPVHLLRQSGIRDCPVCRETLGKKTDHEHLRTVCIVAATQGPVPAPWEDVSDQTIISVSRELGVELIPID